MEGIYLGSYLRYYPSIYIEGLMRTTRFKPGTSRIRESFTRMISTFGGRRVV
jgi:hypothetical protein